MKNYKFLLFLGVLGCFQVLGMAQELVIEREKKAPDQKWVRVEGTEFFTGTFWFPRDPADYVVDPFDPFGNDSIHWTTQNVLESVGIEFPKGATAVHNASGDQLVVKNTLENLERIQTYFENGLPIGFSTNITIRTEIYEVTTLQVLQLQESAQPGIDHRPERDAALKAVREGGARLVAAHSITTTPGQRTKVEDTTKLMIPEMVQEQVDPKPRKTLVEYPYGTILEAEPNLEADWVTIMLNIALEHHTAEPEMVAVAGEENLPKFHSKSVLTNVQLLSGEYLLLTTWKPTGKPEYAEKDLTQVVFVTASVRDDSE